MTIKYITAILALSLVMAATARAEQVDEDQQAQSRWKVIDGKNHVYTRVGIEPALGITLGYGREFDFAGTGRSWLLFGELSSPFVSFGKSGAFQPGVSLPIVRAGLFRFSTEATFKLGWTRNRNYNSVRLAPGLTLLPGLGRANGRWYIDGEFGYERAIANHIEHTDFHREVFYEDAKDGWYYGTGGRFRMGLRIGCRINRWNLELRVAHDRTERFKDTMGSPFVATAGVGARF